MNQPLSARRPKKPIRPGIIAPIIPTWGLLAFFGVQQFGGTRWFAPFLAAISVLFVLLFWFVARQLVSARKLRRATRRLG